jgi:hypothetical protein
MRGRTIRPRAAYAVVAALGSNSEAGAAAGTARVNHRAATLGFHTNEESVGAGALGNRGLISSFHDVFDSANPKLQSLSTSVSREGVDTRSMGPVDKFDFGA